MGLPFLGGMQFTVTQGPMGPTHGGEHHWDLAVPLGTPVVAVRSGVVLDVWTPEGGAGCHPRFAPYAHNLKILHRDGTVAQYVHVTAQVSLGQQVRLGEVIAVTGHSGFLCRPHLHLGVYASEEELPNSAEPRTLPLSFREMGLLEVGKTYRVKSF